MQRLYQIKAVRYSVKWLNAPLRTVVCSSLLQAQHLEQRLLCRTQQMFSAIPIHGAGRLELALPD